MQKSLVALLVAMSLSACGGSDKNSPPNFSQNSYVFNVNEDSVVQGQLSATDPDNDSLSFSVEVKTNNGVLTLNPAVGMLAQTKMMAVHLALLDHFPQSDIASIDTDQDGKPNFFSLEATAEQINLSGLQLDDDADNDGVKDPQDKAPLDASKS